MKILYICTHNRCRSILSEAITNHFGEGKIQAQSAGSQPVGEVHPLSIKYLNEAGISTEGLRSQSWHDFEEFEPDIVVTVCDSAAGEACPLWFGQTIKVHWGWQTRPNWRALKKMLQPLSGKLLRKFNSVFTGC